MKDIIHFEPLTQEKYQTYIEVGSHAYRQHYLHLWLDRNATPYPNSSFTNRILDEETTDKNTALFLIDYNGRAVGILKFTIHHKLPPFSKMEALYLDNICIKNEYSGQGIGKKVLQFAMLRAKENYRLAGYYAKRTGIAFLH